MECNRLAAGPMCLLAQRPFFSAPAQLKCRFHLRSLCLCRDHDCMHSRVIALAYKQLPAEPSAAELRSMARSEAESGLTFAGFAIFQCPLKPESEPALRMLRDSNHQARLLFAVM